MAYVLNQTASMLSIKCEGKMLNFIPGTLVIVGKEEMDELKKNNSFKQWVDSDKLLTGNAAKKADVSEEISDESYDESDSDKEK